MSCLSVISSCSSLTRHTKPTSFESPERIVHINIKAGTVSSILVTCGSEINTWACCNLSKLTRLISLSDTQTPTTFEMSLCCYSSKKCSQTEKNVCKKLNCWYCFLKMLGMQHLTNTRFAWATTVTFRFILNILCLTEEVWSVMMNNWWIQHPSCS